ncbi:von Willebrand factor D and EGF domain-containing protein-like [Lingula anatina]|uniref:von Willebrand factor D and EGF domain-containing protein-like n=1 Tax=Lingula anatina TaxID=7574 RepID=A0A1S3K9D2_LINAN|nr:von Willebrand factor D and EGF domain-containing protein-like [Lingula anatina]|eukprot:XP_013419235.1 von Willebrand factor D and EGF domain-containing protein-like [Lingula anatina]
MCTDAAKSSSAYTQCLATGKIDVNEIVGGCVDDMKISDGDTEFLSSVVTAFENTCQEKVLKDPNSYTKNATDGTLIMPAFVTADLCTTPCQHGRCSNGACVCNNNWVGEDCSVDATKPPQALGLTRPEACDIRKRPCRLTFLDIENIADTSKLKCRLKDLTIVNGKVSTVGGNVAFSKADFQNYAEVSCEIPESPAHKGTVASHAYHVSVTFDNNRWSNDVMFVIYDSLCQNCTEKGTCTINANSCHISGKCYSAGDHDPTDTNNVCLPAISATKWTQVSVPTQPPPQIMAASTTPRPATPKATPFPLHWAKYGGENKMRWDIWTKAETGCSCYFDQSKRDCACCELGGCQCPTSSKYHCVKCGEEFTCGTVKPSTDFGIDGWTATFTGCPCVWDTKRPDCACCQNLGCPCGKTHRNQCTQCGHPAACGTKPEIFGPPLNDAIIG